MSTAERRSLPERLRAFFRVIETEAAQNPGFARELDQAFGSSGPSQASSNDLAVLVARSEAAQTASNSFDSKLRIPAASFDPLAVHLEVALMNGREQEARDFLKKLSRSELSEVVHAQRLPGAKALQKAISEATDTASVLDDLVASAGQKAKGRFSAAT